MKKSRTTAAILAIFGGMFGIDRFYLGQYQLGIFLTFLTVFSFSAFGLPLAAIVGLLHGMFLLNSTDEDFDKKHNKSYFRQRGRTQQTRIQRENKKASRELREMDMQRERYAYKKQTKQRSNPFISSGIKKLKEYDLEGALKDFDEALEISPENIKVHYHMATAYSLKEDVSKSLFHLDKAISYGFKDKEKILNDDNLAYLRIQPEYESYKNNGYNLKAVKGIGPAKKEEVKDDVLLNQLNKLKDLRDRGLLSQKEFLYEREKLGRK